MRIEILNETGYREALLGMSLSFYDHAEPLESWWNEEKFNKAEKRAELLAPKDGGHNKFLESIQVWIYIQASRDFWQEFDTYRAGVTKQSSSTMHTLDKRMVTEQDFEEGTSPQSIAAFNECLAEYKNPESIYFKNISRLKKNLPEGWLQERIVCTNYKVLKHIYAQRSKHRLKEWPKFLKEVTDNLQYPNLILIEGKTNGNAEK